MRSKVQRWGNSLAVRIPRELAIAGESDEVELERVGNTSAASIPLALREAVDRDVLKRGDLVLAAAFGGGLTWASCVVKWTYDPADRQWSTWRRGVQWARYRVAGVKTLLNRADRHLAALDDRLRRRDNGRK